MRGHLKKFVNSLAFSMGTSMMYVPGYCVMHAVRSEWGIWMGVVMFVAICLVSSYLLYLLIGDVHYKEVDEDKRIKGIGSMGALGLLLLAGGLYVEEYHPQWQWVAIGAILVILFIAAYSISKNYILKK